MTMISGFEVVRKPEYSEAVYHKVSNIVDGKVYRGVDRLPWEDLDTAFYDRTLPADLVLARKKLKENNKDLTGLTLTNDYALASMIERYFGSKSEVIAIWSPELQSIKGDFSWIGSLEFLGFDCVSLGEWSLILNGPFIKRQYFGDFINRLNENGLVNAEEDCREILFRYLRLSEANLAEPLRDKPLISFIKVYRASSELKE